MTEFSAVPDSLWQVEGRLVEASNVVLRMAATATHINDDSPRAVYKPLDGERPLSDFPAGTLAHREVAAWIVADAGGWTCVPATHWYTGEFGDGSLQRWVGPLAPQEQDVVALLQPDDLDESQWIPIAAFETDEGPVVLAHADDERLRHIAALDLVLGNADRKGSHIVVSGESLYAIDNGLSFHAEDKLRTVLWGWAGEPLGDDILEHLRRLDSAASELRTRLAPHLSAHEIEVFQERVHMLLESTVFPQPPQDRYGLPWPPL